MLLKLLSRKVLVGLLATGAVVGTVTTGALVFGPSVALADYTPPALIDAQTYLLQKGVRRHRLLDGGFGFTCHALCRSAETGGARPRGCALAPAMDAGTFAGADVECLQEAVADCTPQGVHECQNPVALP